MRKFLHILSIILFNIFVLNSNGIAQRLYVGANYHPHDLTIKEWRRDIALMKFPTIDIIDASGNQLYPIIGIWKISVMSTIKNTRCIILIRDTFTSAPYEPEFIEIH